MGGEFGQLYNLLKERAAPLERYTLPETPGGFKANPPGEEPSLLLEAIQ
jgi:hypothetical protein